MTFSIAQLLQIACRLEQWSIYWSSSIERIFPRYILETHGEPGIDELHTLTGQKGICIDLDEGIDDFYDEQLFSLAEKQKLMLSFYFHHKTL